MLRLVWLVAAIPDASSYFGPSRCKEHGEDISVNEGHQGATNQTWSWDTFCCVALAVFSVIFC